MCAPDQELWKRGFLSVIGGFQNWFTVIVLFCSELEAIIDYGAQDYFRMLQDINGWILIKGLIIGSND